MALSARLIGRGLLGCNGLRGLSVTQCRQVTLQPRPAPIPIEEGHDERNMRLCRPQSPHLTIYKFQLTSMLSITHRFTGLALSGYAAAFAITSLLSDKPMGEIIQNISQCNPTFLLLFKLGLLFPMSYHLCNGIRHLVWDTGKALTLKGVYVSGYLMLLFSMGIASGVVYYFEELKRIERELELQRIAEEEAAKAAAEAEAAAAAAASKKSKKSKKVCKKK